MRWRFVSKKPLTGPLASVVLAGLVGVIVPDPTHLTMIPVLVVLPMVVAGLIASAPWTLVAGAITGIIMVGRTDGTLGILVDPESVLVMLSLALGIMMIRLVADRAHDRMQTLEAQLDVRITERTASLTAQYERTERILRERTALYNAVAYDLRGDATVVALLAGDLTDAWRSGDDEAVKRSERRLMRSARRYASYAQDLRDVACVGSGMSLPMHTEAVDLPELAMRLIDDVTPEARPYAVGLYVETRPGVIRAWCDPMRIERILHNLMLNAITAVRSTERAGSVIIRFSMQDDMTVRCDIVDTGVGITPVTLRKLGHRMVRVALPGIGGDSLGMGLTLSAHMVQLMGGILSLDSLGHGYGATATFMLPAVERDDEDKGYQHEDFSPLIRRSSEESKASML